jgi:hypothetical protein
MWLQAFEMIGRPGEKLSKIKHSGAIADRARLRFSAQFLCKGKESAATSIIMLTEVLWTRPNAVKGAS